MPSATMIFPKDFRWGTATAAYQVEGGNTDSDWWQWEQTPGAILNGDRSGRACDWWEKAEDDIARAAELGTNAHRMALDWSRIEPEPGRFDDAALGRYREILQAMHRDGIEPMVTLHHFVNPTWLVELGDFTYPDITTLFQRYTHRVVTALGDLVGHWLTINEPLVYINMRYVEAKFPPPNARGFRAAVAAFRGLLRCHAIAYHTIKRAYPTAQVGVAKQLRPFYAPKGGLPARWWAGRLDYVFNRLWLEAMNDGYLRLPIGRERLPHLAGSYDFIGINYYTYSNIAWPPGIKLYDETYPADAIVGDGNYGEMWPSGLFEMIKLALPYGRPIYITENGMPDHDDDNRPAFILTHLRELWRAISFNFPIMGYYYWSLVDNFEWDRGWTQRFGLYSLDPVTQVRTLTNSGRMYGEICRSGEISSDLVTRYAPQVLDRIFYG